nr:MAG TPA: hyaluronidase [Caudoviricetes sp.]
MTQIKLRRDTAAHFTSKNPVLGVGEPAYETDTKKLKIGDGTTAYTQLAYFSSGGGSSDITATLPIKIVDGVISLEVDGQTIQIVDGKLHANLDELGNEVNNLSGRVTAAEANILTKQDKLTAGDNITISTDNIISATGGGLEVKIASTADFNSAELLETGLYFISGGFNPQNGPSPYATAAMLITMKYYSERSNQCIQQTWIGCKDLVGNHIYTRYSKANGVMNAWTRVDSNKIASASVLGSIKVGDGLTIASDGTLSASGGGDSVDLTSNQTITGAKTFDKIVIPSSLVEKGIFLEGSSSPSIYQYSGSLYIKDLASLKTDQIKVVDSSSNGEITLGNFPEYGQAEQKLLFTSTRDTGGTIIISGLALNKNNVVLVGDSDFPLVIKGSTIKDNNNAEFVRLVESHIDKTGGYRLYSDGYCEQWGDTSGVALTSITFLKPYKDTKYTVLTSSGYPDDLSVYNSFFPYNKTKTGFSINWQVTVRTNMWRAFGYV